MKNILRTATFGLIFATFLSMSSSARAIENPVTWSASVKHIKGNAYELRITPSFSAEGWHTYDLGPYEGGPVATSISVSGDARIIGNPSAVGAVKYYDDVFEMEIGTCSEGAYFVQQVEAVQETQAQVNIDIEWQACNDDACMRPETFTLTTTIPGMKNGLPLVWKAIIAIIVLGGISLLVLKRRYCR